MIDAMGEDRLEIVPNFLAGGADQRHKKVPQFYKNMSDNLEKHIFANIFDPSTSPDAPQEEKSHKRKKLQLGDGLSEEQRKHSQSEVYDLFFAESPQHGGFVGVGCIIKEASGRVVFQNGQCIGFDFSHYLAEYMALIYGLENAKSMGLRRITVHGNRAFIYWEVRRMIEAPEAGEQLVGLQKQIKELESFSVKCISRAENECTIKVAEYAAKHSRSSNLISSAEENKRKGCPICLEDIFPSDMVCQKGCSHFFCFNCLSQHVEHQVSIGKVPVPCPKVRECATHMDSDVCKSLVSPKLFDSYLTRLTEATIADLEKVYCPFPGCSAVMVRTGEKKSTVMYAANSLSSIPPSPPSNSRAECMECHRLFCMDCLVPWHANLTCRQFQALPNAKSANDRKLLELAKDQKWRTCGKCRSLIVLASGCFHMTCRCGNQFCYTCGANYKGRKKMCTCPLFSYPHPTLNRPTLHNARLGQQMLRLLER